MLATALKVYTGNMPTTKPLPVLELVEGESVRNPGAFGSGSSSPLPTVGNDLNKNNKFGKKCNKL